MSKLTESYTEHQSVLLNECVDSFEPIALSKKQPIFADLTFGGGGHTFTLANTYKNSKIISTDQDPDAFANGQKLIREKQLEDRITLVKTNFSNLSVWLKENSIQTIDGVLMDLGVSSHHFDETDRGFSYRQDAQLDMRMSYDNEEQLTAKDVVNDLSEEELSDIFFHYGEERLSRRIASKIVEERRESPIETTKQLENIIFHCYPKKMRFQKTHPATRCFQALRIYVNRELEVLEKAMNDLWPFLSEGGRMSIISFHSLEDRIVKHKFRHWAKEEKSGRLIVKKPIIPSEEEINLNKRSRSAKLRIIEKVS